jgi:hypothetical protein
MTTHRVLAAGCPARNRAGRVLVRLCLFSPFACWLGREAPGTWPDRVARRDLKGTEHGFSK